MRTFRYSTDSGITDITLTVYDSNDAILTTLIMPETSISGIYRADVNLPIGSDFGLITSASANIQFIFRLPYNETSQEITTTIKSDTLFSKLFNDSDITALIETGDWQILNNQMIFFAQDGITVLKTFNLTDAAGNPTETQVYKRSGI